MPFRIDMPIVREVDSRGSSARIQRPQIDEVETPAAHMIRELDERIVFPFRQPDE
jgi:hypothetical protein